MAEISRCSGFVDLGLGRDEIKPPALRIKRHGPRAGLCLHVGQHLKGVSALLGDDRQGALAVGAEYALSHRIKRRAVRVRSNRQRCDDLAIVGVDCKENVVFAAGEEPPRARVNGKSMRACTLGNRPMRSDAICLRVDPDNLPLGFAIYKQHAGTIRHGYFELATTVNCGQACVGLRIDYGDLARIAVNDEDVTACRVEDNSVGIVIRLDRLTQCERLEVEGCRCFGSPSSRSQPRPI